MVMFTPSQSYSGGVIVKPYTGNIAQELQFLTGGHARNERQDRMPKKKEPNPILRQ